MEHSKIEILKILDKPASLAYTIVGKESRDLEIPPTSSRRNLVLKISVRSYEYRESNCDAIIAR